MDRREDALIQLGAMLLLLLFFLFVVESCSCEALKRRRDDDGGRKRGRDGGVLLRKAIRPEIRMGALLLRPVCEVATEG